MMPKTFHGRIDETVDALIILEACRQGVMPRTTRRLLAAERGETTLMASDRSTSTSSSSTLSIPLLTTNHSTNLSATDASCLLLPSSTMACKSSSQSTFTPTFPSESTQPVASSSTSSMPNPSLITPGSVFVFDEQESGIYRWTDGKIWSPSRICGNFLVYRELYRKLPNQKCLTTSDKDKMKDGSGLIDRALREKVEEENMVVMGCTKGTFVLKKDGLIKKTICVKGINLLPPEELKKRLEVLPISMSRHNGSSNRGSGRRVANEQKPLPGLSIKGTTQHLVCYEKPGEMQGLHSPRDYIELRDLPISKTFVTIQSYRIPIKILPLESNQQPLDLADEYIHSSRIVEARNSKVNTLSTPPRSYSDELNNCRGIHFQHRKNEETNQCEKTMNKGNGGGLPYYSRTKIKQSSLTAAMAQVHHGYATRSQNRQISMQSHSDSHCNSPSSLESTPTRKKLKLNLPVLKDIETIKNEMYSLSGASPCPASSTSIESSVQNTSNNSQELIQHPINDSLLQRTDHLIIHGYKSLDGQWHIVSSSNCSSDDSGTAAIDLQLQHQHNFNAGYRQSIRAYSYQQVSHWDQPRLEQEYSQKQLPWRHSNYNQAYEQSAYPSMHPTQQQALVYHKPLPLVRSQTRRPRQLFSNNNITNYSVSSISSSMSTPILEPQEHCSHSISQRERISCINSGTTSSLGFALHLDKDGSQILDSETGFASAMNHLGCAFSPRSNGSRYSRSSSLSSSLTLSPVENAQTSANQVAASVSYREDYQLSPRLHITDLNQTSYDHFQLTNEYQDKLNQVATSTTAHLDDRTQQLDIFSFTQNDSSIELSKSSKAQAATSVSLAINVQSTINSITDDKVSLKEPSPVLLCESATESQNPPTSNNFNQNKQVLTLSNQPFVDPFQDNHPFFRSSRKPYIPVMTFLSGTVLGTCVDDTTPESHETLDISMKPSIGDIDTSILKQEQLVKDRNHDQQSLPYYLRTRDFPLHVMCGEESTEIQIHRGPLVPDIIATTTVAMTPSAISSDVHSAINRFETINSEPYPYITPQLTGNTHFSQARMNYLHAPKFSSQNISSPDELNHILRISPQQKSDTMERKRNNMKAQHEIQEEDELQTIGLLNVLDPGTLSALHHISKEELQRVSMSPAPNSSRASSLELNSTGGGLGQDEYLLHRTHSIMDRIGGTKGGLSIGTEARVGTGLEFGSSGNYEYAVTSADRFGGDNAGSSRRNNSDNQGADTLDEGLSWATNRQENITSSEIACQLFSGLDVFRRREEEGRMITNKIGVGIGTTIGSRTYCENDSSGRHQISEDFSRSESPNERWQRILDEYNHN